MQPTNLIPLVDADLLRRCKKCKVIKLITLFTKAKQCTYGYTHTCRACTWKIRAPEFKRDRKKRAKRENYLNRERKQILVEYFGNKCYDCGSNFEDVVYDFHHLDPKEKDFKLSNFRRRPKNLLQDQELLREIKKCVMLCANCHRIRHWCISDWTDRKEGKG